MELIDINDIDITAPNISVDIEKENSTHKVEVVRIKLLPHPNADTLSIVEVFGGYPCVVKTEQWKDGDLAAYIVPDSLVDTSRPEFAFLNSGNPDRIYEKVSVRKFRKCISFGLLVPAPEGSQEGDNVAELLGVKHYEPKPKGQNIRIPRGEEASPPPGFYPKYDVDSLRRYKRAFFDRELVVVTEKIDGANARYVYKEGQMYCGSRQYWKKQTEDEFWWKTLQQYPDLERFCRDFEGFAVYGEIYGWVQTLRYGMAEGQRAFAAFDILSPKGQWLNWEEAVDMSEGYDFPWVPLLCSEYAFNWDELVEEAEKDSLIVGANHMREGIVIRPVQERIERNIGRVHLKLVSSRYLASN